LDILLIIFTTNFVSLVFKSLLLDLRKTLPADVASVMSYMMIPVCEFDAMCLWDALKVYMCVLLFQWPYFLYQRFSAWNIVMHQIKRLFFLFFFFFYNKSPLTL